MKVLIADKFEESGLSALRQLGCDVAINPDLADDELRKAIVDSECTVLIVRGTKLPAEMFEHAPKLSLVVRAGAGYNTIDVDAASKKSVLVANCPGKNAVAVAELAMGLILAIDRRIVDGTVDLRAGKWNKKLYSKASGLKTRTLGIIGMGQIGQAVARRGRAFEMKVIAWSRSLTDEAAEELGVRRAPTMMDIARESDVVSVHLAAAPETKKCINADFFAAMKDGATFINTARGDVVDYDALANAIETKKLRVGLDVYGTEPASGTGEFTDRIIHAGGIVYGTHHVGASTDQAQEAIAAETVRVVRTYIQKGEVLNCVNLCDKSPAQYVLVVRHLNRPGVLAHTLHAISHAGVNVEEMQNVITAGAHAACAQIKLDGDLQQSVLDEIGGNEHVLGVSIGPLEG